MTHSHRVESSARFDHSGARPFGRLRGALYALLAVFAALAALIMLAPSPTAPERFVDRVLQATQGSAMFETARAASFIGSSWVVAALAVLLSLIVWRTGGRRSIVMLCIAAPALAGVGEMLLKHVVGRSRPPTGALTGVSGYSFPSGHTSGATALALVGVVAVWVMTSDRGSRRRVMGAALLYSGVVGISRVVVGAHFSLDVVGGWLFGSATALLAFLVVRSGFWFSTSSGTGEQAHGVDRGAATTP